MGFWKEYRRDEVPFTLYPGIHGICMTSGICEPLSLDEGGVCHAFLTVEFYFFLFTLSLFFGSKPNVAPNERERGKYPFLKAKFNLLDIRVDVHQTNFRYLKFSALILWAAD